MRVDKQRPEQGVYRLDDSTVIVSRIVEKTLGAARCLTGHIPYTRSVTIRDNEKLAGFGSYDNTVRVRKMWSGRVRTVIARLVMQIPYRARNLSKTGRL